MLAFFVTIASWHNDELIRFWVEKVIMKVTTMGGVLKMILDKWRHLAVDNVPYAKFSLTWRNYV